MNRASHFLLSILLTLAAWAWVSWPLPLHLTKGICAFPDNPRQAHPQEMVAGDHLQLLYQLELAHDSWFGPTPMGYNLYEFNVGDDEARRVYTTYYFPYNLSYSIGRALGSQALGWNLSGLFSIWVGLVFTQLWVRRFVPDAPWISWGAALAGQLLPYRWHTLLNGSPTGLALMWIPVVLLGLDLCIRDKKARGAMLAGAAVFFSGWSDTHALFFGGMLCAVWALPTHWHARRRMTVRVDDLLNYLKAGWPLLVWAGLVVLQAGFVKNSVKGTNTEHGRTEAEVALFSHLWEDSVGWKGWGGIEEAFLGWLFVALVLMGLGGLLWKTSKKECPPRQLTTYLILCVGITVATLLATGVSNPWGPPGWAVVTKLIPPLGMLRQPAKIFLALCPLISLLLALGLSSIPRRGQRVSVLLTVLLIGISWTWRFNPTICLLDKGNKAYAAVAANSESPRAMALPLWPGDSHWSSLYQHYAILDRIRMINGYRPSLMHWYQEEIFIPYSQFNSGSFPDEQLDGLLDREVRHLILHENSFPEKVSPFAVGNTLAKMLQHPRLQRVEQDGPVHAFQILDKPAQEAVAKLPKGWNRFGAVRRWNAEFSEGEFEIINDEQAFKGKAVTLREADDPLTLFRYTLTSSPEYQLLLRLRGDASLQLQFQRADESLPLSLNSSGAEWSWHSLSLPEADAKTAEELSLTLRSKEGAVDVDICMLLPAAWTPQSDGVQEISAGTLFHAGHSDVDTGNLILLPERDPRDEIVYGPNFPLDAGRYQLEMIFRSEAENGSELGELRLRGVPRVSTPVVNGRSATLSWEHNATDLFTFAFRYNATHPMQVIGFRLTPKD